MLFLENLLGLKSKQADVDAAFLNAILQADEKIYVEMPLDFKQHCSNRKFEALCLKKTPYCQSPHAVWKYLTKNLVAMAYLKLLLTPASPLVKGLLPSVILMI